MPHQPQLSQNPFVNPGSVTPTGLSTLGSRRPREREDINVQLARSLLLDPKITDTHRLRLKGIIAANSPADREAQEKETAIQRRRFERALDRNPDMTAAEVANARGDFEAHNPGQAAPFALTLAAETARDESALTTANSAQHFQDEGFGHADSHLPYIALDENGQVDAKQLLVYRKQLMDERRQGQDSASERDKVAADLKLQKFQQLSNMFLQNAITNNVEGDLQGNLERLSLSHDQISALHDSMFPEDPIQPAAAAAAAAQPNAADPAQTEVPEAAILEKQATALGRTFLKSPEHFEQLLKSGQVRPGDPVITWDGRLQTVK